MTEKKMEEAFERFWTEHANEILEEEWRERCRAFRTAQGYKDYVWSVFSEGFMSA